MSGEYSRYLVCGTRRYRGHEPGMVFDAALDPLAEQRAIARGAIRLLARIPPMLEPGSYQLPQDWPTEASDPDHPRRREAPLSFGKEGQE